MVRTSSRDMPPLPITIFVPVRSSQSAMYFENRNEAVAVTPPIRYSPPSSAAAGEQWKLALVTSASPSGSFSPLTSTRS